VARVSIGWLLGGLVGVAALLSARAVMSIAQRRELYRPLFDAATARYGLPAGLLLRQAEVESSLDPNARSSAGAIGLMQIIPRWHPALGEAGALDPARAIPYAAQILRAWRDQFGSWTLALAAYNAGPGAVTQHRGVPPFAETRNYISKILPAVGIYEPQARYA
jgi:peptidoglycan DL-endopeptidase CwlO